MKSIAMRWHFAALFVLTVLATVAVFNLVPATGASATRLKPGPTQDGENPQAAAQEPAPQRELITEAPKLASKVQDVAADEVKIVRKDKPTAAVRVTIRNNTDKAITGFNFSIGGWASHGREGDVSSGVAFVLI